MTQRPLSPHLGVLTLALVAVVPAPAEACQPVISYLKPSNYELVEQADRVVYAQASGAELRCRTRFELLEALKGELPARELILEGCAAEPGRAVLPLPQESSFSHARGSEYGSCIRMTYELRQRYILLLESTPNGWDLLDLPFTRVNEPVAGPEAPWFRAVTEYARISALEDYELEKRELEALAERASSDGAKALADDIARHFDTVSEAKSYADLRALYDATTDEDRRRRVLFALAERGDLEAKPLFDALLASGRADSPVAFYFEKIGDTGSLESFIAAFLAAKDSGDWWARIAPLGGLLGIADERHVPLVLKVYADAQPGDEARMIEQWFVAHPAPSARRALQKRIRDYDNDYEAAWALAAAGDAHVVKWAILDARTGDEDNSVALRALALSPLDEADNFVRELIAHPDERLVPLVQGYADARHPRMAQRLRDVVDLSEKPKALTAWLWRTLETLREEKRLLEADALMARLPSDALDYFEEE